MRVDLPLIRRRDKKPVGEITLIRTTLARFTGDDGNTLPNPVQEDSLIVTITSPAGEQICWLSVPMDKLRLD